MSWKSWRHYSCAWLSPLNIIWRFCIEFLVRFLFYSQIYRLKGKCCYGHRSTYLLLQASLYFQLSRIFYFSTQMKLTKNFLAVSCICFLNLYRLSVVLLSRVILFPEKEIFLPLMIKIEIYSCLLQKPWCKIYPGWLYRNCYWAILHGKIST